MAIAALVKFTHEMCGATESGLRLAKVAQQYSNLGHRFTQLTGLKSAEEILKVMTSFQNPYRVVKAGSLFLTLRKVGETNYDEGGLKLGTASNQNWKTESACYTHKVITYLSPITLAIVSAVGFGNSLGGWGILPISKAWQGRLILFTRYAGGYFGNGLAAFAGAFGAYHLKRQADIEAGQSDPASKGSRNEAESNAFGSAKYGADLLTSILGNYFEADGVVIVGVKLASSHLAVVQSGVKAAFKSGLYGQ